MLAKRIGLKEERIEVSRGWCSADSRRFAQVWFKNRRAKWRKQQREGKQEMGLGVVM
jgi:hypothetical protein